MALGLIATMKGDLEDRVHYDPDTDEWVLEKRDPDVTPFIQYNKRLRNEGDGYTPSRDLRRAASIPPIIYLQWKKEGIDAMKPEDWPKVAARLDSQEWQFLRTAPGRLSSRPDREVVVA